jgi:hypothetical protein
MNEDFFHLGIKALIKNADGKILLLKVNTAKLKDFHGEPYWDIPGGRVQNGGFKKKVLVDYTAYLKSNPQATETQRLNKILELRLQDVLSQWQSDVSSRKLALINSVGMVHGAKRNLPQEYCYQQNDKIITKP